MKINNTASAGLTLLLLSLGACQDQPVSGAPDAEAPGRGTTLAELRCVVSVAPGTVSCQDAEASGNAGGASRTMVTVGGQHHYVRLANSGTVYDAVAGTFSTTVTVQNLLLAALGTADGTTPHASGVRVFFASRPTNGVTVANADGETSFLNPSHEYFQYSGSALGADGVLSPDETSAGKQWVFNTNGASTFTFTVYVQAQVPTGVDLTARFTQLSAGTEHTCARTQAGKAYCWGSDHNGRLGNGTALTANQGVPSPVQMPAGVSVTSISAGLAHTCLVGSDSRAYCWGWDYHGQVGNGTTVTAPQETPVRLEMPEGGSVTSVSAGYRLTCAVVLDGRAYCWGWDENGQLGNGTTLTGDQHSPTPVQMPVGVSFTSIAAGLYHSCALASDGRAYCWGNDGHGQLGNGTTLYADQHSPSPVQMPAGVSFTRIAVGASHTCARGSDGHAYCWGWDGFGQLGNDVVPASKPSPSRVAMPAGVSVTDVSTGYHYACALGSDGRAYCWGNEVRGELGNGATVTGDHRTPSPVEMPAGVTFGQIDLGFRHSCAISSGGPSYCWGNNELRSVGDGTSIDRHVPVVVAGTK
jgi:alpha-tubulin suppressor-like RCC1 family protein